MLYKVYNLIIIFFTLFFLWLISSVLAMGYEEKTNTTFLSKTNYNIATIINCTNIFWQRYLPSTLAICCSILTSSLIVYFIYVLIKEYIFKKK
jgi:hypothetical protein